MPFTEAFPRKTEVVWMIF